MIIIHALFTVNPAQNEAFLEEIRPLIAASRAEAGNISYGLYQDTEQEHKFMMLETWKDAEAVASHNVSGHFTSFAGKASTFLTSPLDVKAYHGDLLNS